MALTISAEGRKSIVVNIAGADDAFKALREFVKPLRNKQQRVRFVSAQWQWPAGSNGEV